MKRTCIDFESNEQLALFKAALKCKWTQASILRVGTRGLEVLYWDYKLGEESTDEERQQADIFICEYYRILKGKS